MAETQEKEFDPTPRRLEQARERGNLPRAQEIVTVGLLMSAVLVMSSGGASAFATLQDVASRLFLQANQTTLTLGTIRSLAAEVGVQIATAMFPLYVVLAVMAVGLNVAQTGWNVSLTPLEPKFSRINPIKGFGRIFSSKGAFGFAKALLKLGAVGPLAYFILRDMLPEIVQLHTLPLPAILGRAGDWLVELLWKILAALLVVAALDFAFERWKYYEDLKMSKKEMEDERKETEGDPQVEEKRREKQEELAKQPRMDHAVMKSDAVVTNPTHYAVALRYDPDESPAPRVLLKGVRKRAKYIKELAEEFDVPMVENRPLAHALYENVPEEDEIPQELYPAVATVLAEVYKERRED